MLSTLVKAEASHQAVYSEGRSAELFLSVCVWPLRRDVLWQSLSHATGLCCFNLIEG